METKLCQSCAMPMADESVLGTEKDGSKSADYCSYCYENGAFTYEASMEEMIDQCVPHMVGEVYTEESARAMMEKTLPELKRWRQ